ncbi:MAG TPA: hypothetical protein VKQ30_23230 [Ktedonobacterales bacterium]|nr:hypothetical protein [Ktedonobacterales bacterium]
MTLTVQMGEVPFEFDTSGWHALIGKHLQGAFDYETLSPGKRTLVRIGMKVLMHELLDQFERAIIRGYITAPAPDRDRADADVLTYGASYLAAFLIAELEKLSFIADTEEQPNGAIRITGLRPAAAVGGAEAASLFLAAGPENGPERAGIDATPAASQPAQSAGDRRSAGGHVDAGRDQGQRQDLRGEATGPRAFEALS